MLIQVDYSAKDMGQNKIKNWFHTFLMSSFGSMLLFRISAKMY